MTYFLIGLVVGVVSTIIVIEIGQDDEPHNPCDDCPRCYRT